MDLNRLIMVACLWLVAAALAIAEEPARLPPPSQQDIDYAGEIRPLLDRRCVECHGPDAQESSFRVDHRQSLLDGGDFGEPAVLVGNSGESHLVRLVSGLDPSLVMPPDSDPLTEREIGLLRAWIDQGLRMPAAEPATADAGEIAHWSLQPIERPPVPEFEPPAATESGINPIDAFVLQRLRHAGLEHSPTADSRMLIRRVYLDMLGLLPTPEEVQAFVRDPHPDAYSRLVDAVLASPQYGERWARHWLDVVRFAESNGFETNHERPSAYHYRDYVVRALNEDKPFDRFVFEQLAGDTVGADAATGFLVGGANDVVASPDPALTAMQRQDELADMINTTGTALLGLTIGCARCHNHKFDPVTQEDYYAMQAVFAGVRHGERAMATPQSEQSRREAAQLAEQIDMLDRRLGRLLRPANEPGRVPPVDDAAPARPRSRAAVSPIENEERFEPRAARLVRFTISATNNGTEPCLDELEVWSVARDRHPPRNVALASAGAVVRSSGDYEGDPKHKPEHINDGQYGNGRSWISSEPGRGWIEIELPEPVVIERITWGRDREEQYADRVPVDYRIEVAEESGELQQVASSENRLPPDIDADVLDLRLAQLPAAQAEQARSLVAQRDQLRDRRARLLAQPMAYAGRFEEPGPTYRLYRGDPAAPREQVAPDAVTVLGSLGLPTDTPEPRRRIALAESIIAPENPLTARVIANRLWHYHFGRGLVATPSDFGAMGASPSHPELLDWLAAELRDGPRRDGPQETPHVPRSADAKPWSLKHLHRLILLSATYRQSSRPTAEGLAKDADSRLLWRYPPRRLEAEAIRDNILLVSGSLDIRMEGPGFMTFHPNDNYARNWIAKDEFGPPEFRRMLYATKLRMEQDAVFGAFDCPDAGQVAPQRTESTTPIQSLNLLNSDFVIDQARRFADRVRQEVGEDASLQVAYVFRVALGRAPEPEELTDAVTLVDDHGLPALCRAIYNANAFLFLR